MLNESNKNHTAQDPYVDALLTHFDLSDSPRKLMTVTSILEVIRAPHNNRASQMGLATALKTLNIDKKRTRFGIAYNMPRQNPA